MTVRQAAARLGVSASTVYTLMATGRLRFIKLGKCRRLRPEDLDALIEHCTTAA